LIELRKGKAMDKLGGWLSFNLAAEEVERRQGVTWGEAQKTVVDWCESGALRWENVPIGGPNISWNDLQRCLRRKSVTLAGKQPRIIAQLEKMFPDGVPDPALCPRHALKADLLKADKSLAPLDPDTLKRAIDAYNCSRRFAIS
jgi:hypothetical protein